MPLTDIVDITISRETTAVSQAGFSVPLIVGESHTLPEVDTVVITFAGDLITGNTINAFINDVALAETICSGDNDADLAVVATKIQALSTVATAVASGVAPNQHVITVTAAAGETVIVNSVTVAAGASATTATIVRTAATRIQFYSSLAEMVAAGFATTDLEYLAATTLLSSGNPPNSFGIGAVYTTDSGVWVTALNAIQLESDEWFWLIITSRVVADQTLVMAWTETQKKYFICSAATAAIIDSTVTVDTASMAGVNYSNGYDNTGAIYHQNSDETTGDEFPDAALAGEIAWRDPGSYTAKFKTLSSVTASSLSTTQRTNALAKNCGIYTRRGGVSMFEEGVSGSGEFIDVIVGIMWLESRMTERIYSRLVNLAKVPFTDAGVAIIEAEVRAQLDDAVAAGLLASWTVTVPEVADVSTANKIARTLPDIEFTGVLAGAVHKTEISGVITV